MIIGTGCDRVTAVCIHADLILAIVLANTRTDTAQGLARLG